MNPQYSSSIVIRPDSEEEISSYSERLLKKANTIEILPTPIDDLVEVAKISEINSTDELRNNFVSSLKSNAQEIFINALQKIRGLADLRERVIYVPKTSNPVRNIFPKAHELGHQVLPWHNIDPSYLDDDMTLSQDVKNLFEREANFFASEIIFQGKYFRKKARDYTASLPAVFKLADMHGASVQATIWRYVEEQDEAVAVVMYYPTDTLDEYGNKLLKLWKIIPSQKFIRKYNDIELPRSVPTGHPLVAVRDLKYSDGTNILEGKDKFSILGEKYTFEWQTWWNNYTLFVLLRRSHALGVIRNILLD